MTIIHDAFGPQTLTPLQTRDLNGWDPSVPAPLLLVISDGHDWTSVPICSLQGITPSADIWWLFKHLSILVWSGQVGGTYNTVMLSCLKIKIALAYVAHGVAKVPNPTTIDLISARSLGQGNVFYCNRCKLYEGA